MGLFERGTNVVVTIKGDDRELGAVYLGAVKNAVDRPERRMYAVDDGTTDGWKLIMETCIASVRPVRLLRGYRPVPPR